MVRVGLLALTAGFVAYLINQLPPVGQPLDRLALQVPWLRERNDLVRRLVVVGSVLVVTAATVALVDSATGTQTSEQRSTTPTADGRRISEQRLPEDLHWSSESEPTNSDEGRDFVSSSGLLENGVLFDTRTYLRCSPTTGDDRTCGTDIYYVLNVAAPDFAILTSLYNTGAYETDQYTCYDRLSTNETLCRRLIGYNTYLLARIDVGAGVGDVDQWDFREDELYRTQLIERLNDVLDNMKPTGRTVDIDRLTIAVGDRTTVRVTIWSGEPDEYVDIELGSPIGSTPSGGICPQLVDGPCTLLAGDAGQTGEAGVTEVNVDWIACAVTESRDVRELAGDYPIRLRGRQSGFEAVASFTVRIRPDDNFPAC